MDQRLRFVAKLHGESMSDACREFAGGERSVPVARCVLAPDVEEGSDPAARHEQPAATGTLRCVRKRVQLRTSS